MRVLLILFQETDFSILFRLLTVLVSSHIYIIYKTTSCTTSSFVYLKSFKELSFLELPFQRESVCKGKAFFLSLQIFSKFFSKKFFRRTSRGLSVSRSLAFPQGKILGVQRPKISASLHQSVIFSGSPSRKRLQRYALFPVLQLLNNYFLRKFFIFSVSRWKINSCRWTFFDASENGWEQPYIIYFARACVRAHIHAYVEGRGKATHRTGIKTAETRKNLLRNFPARKPKTGKRPENAGNGITSPP